MLVGAPQISERAYKEGVFCLLLFESGILLSKPNKGTNKGLIPLRLFYTVHLYYDDPDPVQSVISKYL
jgi:hypothetical protein